MSVTYIGNVAWEPKEIPQWGFNGFGLDSARLAWSGSRELLEAFMIFLEASRFASLPSFHIGTALQWPASPGMYLADWSLSSGSPSFPVVELRYTGLKSGVMPPAEADDSRSNQSVQGSGVDTTSGITVTGTFRYTAARTNWKWIETTTPPEVPRYRFVNFPVNPFDTITGYSITNADTGKPINSVPYSAFVAVFNSLIPTTTVSDYQRNNVVPGKLWECSCTVDYVLTTA